MVSQEFTKFLSIWRYDTAAEITLSLCTSVGFLIVHNFLTDLKNVLNK